MKYLLPSSAALSLLPCVLALSSGTSADIGTDQLQKRNLEERAIAAGHHDSSLSQHDHVKRQRNNRKKECTGSASCRSKYFRPEDFASTLTSSAREFLHSPRSFLATLLIHDRWVPIETANPDTSTPTPALEPADIIIPPATTPSDCQCGYSISALNGAYMPGYFSIDFRNTHSVEDLVSAGFVVNNGWQSGAAASDGTVAYGDVNNFRFAADGLHFVVPGGQGQGGIVSSAEIQYGDGFTKVYSEAEIQVDATPGTCQAFVSETHSYSAGKHVLMLKLLTPRSSPSLPITRPPATSRISRSSPLPCSRAAQWLMLVSS